MVTSLDPFSFHLGEHRALVFPSRLCHTDSDLAVWLPASRILHVGDGIIAPRAFPPINPREACGAATLRRSLAALIEMLPSDAMVVTGHGGVATVDDFRRILEMVDASLARVHAALAVVGGLDRVLEVGLPDPFAGWGGDGMADSSGWLTLVWVGEASR